MSERELGLILAKLESLHEDVQEIKQIAPRVHSLENFRSWATGIGTTCIFLLTTVIALFKHGG